MIEALVFIAALTAWQAPSFEVATIKPSAPMEPGHDSRHMSTTKVSLRFTNVPLHDVIKEAYRVQDDQISGPEWLKVDRYDYAAKLPAGAKESQIPEMLKTLLAERFGLTLHRETRELQMYSLVTAKNGPKLKPADDDDGLDSNGHNQSVHLSGKATMVRFANYLARQVSRPVVDKTGLPGAFQIQLEWDDTISIFTALQDQMGLRLTSGRGPVEVLVIDHVDRVPTEN